VIVGFVIGVKNIRIVGAPLAAPGFDPLVLIVRASQAGRGKQRPYM